MLLKEWFAIQSDAAYVVVPFSLTHKGNFSIVLPIKSKALSNKQREMRQALENLIPLINWKRQNGAFWIGTDLEQRHNYELHIDKRRLYHVLVKKNGRRIRADCCSFQGKKGAVEYMNKYISDTTFQ